MVVISIIILFAGLFSAIVFVGYRRLVKPGIILDQVATARIADSDQKQIEDEDLTGVLRLLASIGGIMSKSPKEERYIRKQLAQGGFRYAGAVRVLSGLRISGCALLLVVGIVCRQWVDDPTRRMLLPLGLAVAGYILPGFILGRWTNRRRSAIVRALPDVLDLLVISTEAGCALDKAILSVSKEFRDFHPIISEELALVNAEMLAGMARTDALRTFAARAGSDELSKLVAILIQTDRFGTSVADALRTQSEFMRVQRQQEVEEKAAKVGVKLMFPIFAFCLPALLVVVAGPGFIQMFHGLAAMGK